MADYRNVNGFAEIAQALDQFPIKYQKNVARGMVRAGAKPVQIAAKAGARKVTGELANGIKITTRITNGAAVAKVVTKGKHAFAAKWVEFGTKAHIIRARLAKALRLPSGAVNRVMHPGARPKPFMLPAFDNQPAAVLLAMGNYARDRLATQHGIDTPEIRVEGDE